MDKDATIVLTYQGFLAFFPEFSDPSDFPPSQFDVWVPIAYDQLNSERYGKSLDLIAALFVAHNMVLSNRERKTMQSGGVGNPSTSAVVTSESVGPLSSSYNPELGTLANAANWNTTTYGQRFVSMRRGFLSGPVYIPAPLSVGQRVWPWMISRR